MAGTVLDLDGQVAAIQESSIDESAVRVGADGLGG